MNLGEFHTRVSNAIKRGTSLDALIPFWVADAARLLEQNYTFSWMRQMSTVVFPAGSVPLSTTLSPYLKSINWAKPILDLQSDGTEWYGDELIGVEDTEVLGVTGGNPTGFWVSGQDGTFTLKLDAIPRTEYKLKLSWNKYTEWPVANTATPALLVRGQYALFAQTLIIFANEQRDPRMAEMYSGILQGALSTLLRSEEELKMQHQNDLKMQYSGLV